MIFVTVGSTSNDFKRLLKEVDRLAKEHLITDAFIQAGKSSYTPGYCRSRGMIPQQEYEECVRKADLIICHGGDGTLNLCLQFRKKMIIVPRRMEYNEHPDNHQLELARYMEANNRALVVMDMKDLYPTILKAEKWEPSFNENPDNSAILKEVKSFIDTYLIPL
jgi:UDP-N-acetylglucosamine transferase subunit ALG13